MEGGSEPTAAGGGRPRKGIRGLVLRRGGGDRCRGSSAAEGYRAVRPVRGEIRGRGAEGLGPVLARALTEPTGEASEELAARAAGVNARLSELTTAGG